MVKRGFVCYASVGDGMKSMDRQLLSAVYVCAPLSAFFTTSSFGQMFKYVELHVF